MHFVIAAAAFAASTSAGWAFGVSFDDSSLSYFWQFLDEPILRHDLIRGVVSLHAQPPLFNLFLGAVLQLCPVHSSAAFATIYAILRLALLSSMSWLLLRLNVGGPLTGILVVGFAVHPAFIVYGNWLFYTLPVAVVLIAGAVALSRFDETGLMRFAHSFGWLACIAMLTRTAFHALWLLILVPVIAALLPVERRRGFVAACIGPLIVVTMCYANVWWRSGVYGPSSWIGMNLAKGWDIPQADAARLVAGGALPPIWTCGPFMWPGRYEDLGYFRGSGRSNPAIDEPYKSTGYPNFNHGDYARISRELLIEDMILIRTRPDLYLRRIVRALDQLTIPGPTLFLVRYDTRRIEWASAAASSLLPRVVLLLGLVGGVAAGARFALQRSRPRHDRVVLAYLVATVVWLTACSTLVEIGENDRIRWEVDPLIVVLVGYSLRSMVGDITDRSEM